MPELPKAMLLAAALLCGGCGVAWFALAMEAHWPQVRGAGTRAGRGAVVGLRSAGALALLASLALCLRADHASMAVLVWIMSTAAGALAVAMTLAWRPRWLRWLIVGLPSAAVR